MNEKLYNIVSVRLTMEEKEKVEAIAKKNDLTVSQVIRKAIRDMK